MRRVAAVVMAMTLAVGAVACSSNGSDSGSGGKGGSGTGGSGGTSSALPASETAGLIPEDVWRKRQDDFLKWANQGELDGGRPLSVIAEATAARRAGKKADLSAATVEAWKPLFDKIDSYTDTADFDINEMLTLWIRDRDQLSPDLAKEIEKRFIAFKYWWTEPTPKGQIDDQYYWTENHQVIYLADEYVAGQTFPDETFTNSGMTGKQHVAHAAAHLKTWFEYRARFGFSEWLSNVYWTEDMKGLLLLAEFAKDPVIARQASMFLDLLFVELAAHVERGTFGSTHGRTYQKDKLKGPDEDTFSIAKMVFDLTPGPYVNADNAVLLAAADRYGPPEVTRKIAAAKGPTVFQLRAGVPLDPNAPVDPKVKPPYGLQWKGEKALMAWWGMGAQFPWQIAPLSVDTVKKYDLFKTSNFQQAADLEPVVADATDDTLRNLAHSLAIQVNPGLLSQVNTYTWRSPGVMLSTAQDWRPGQRGEQDHISQATIGPDALVFAQHPREAAKPGPPGDGGNWTGDGAMPASGQYQNVAVSIYSPQYPGGGGIGSGAYSFTYENYTHAYFPTEKFDEVVQRNGWTIGRKDDGFVAIWSKRPTTWAADPATASGGVLTKEYDLQAQGGPDDVWITEVADASQYAKAGDGTKARFDAFVSAITGSKVSVTYPSQVAACDGDPAGCADHHSYDEGAIVSYDSPSQGRVSFQWTPKVKGAPATTDPETVGHFATMTVKGKAIDLHPTKDGWDSPYATNVWDSQKYEASYQGATLDLDFRDKTRKTTS